MPPHLILSTNIFQISPPGIKVEDIKTNLLVTHLVYINEFTRPKSISRILEDYDYGLAYEGLSEDETFEGLVNLHRVLQFAKSRKASGFVYFFFEPNKALWYSIVEGKMRVKFRYYQI